MNETMMMSIFFITFWLIWASIQWYIGRMEIAKDGQRAIKIGKECGRLIKKLNEEFEDYKEKTELFIGAINDADLKKAVYEFDNHREWLEKLIAASKKKEELIEAIRELRWGF